MMIFFRNFLMLLGFFFFIACGTGSSTTTPRGEMQTEEVNMTTPNDERQIEEVNRSIVIEENNMTEEVEEEILDSNETENLPVESNVTEIKIEENLTLESNISSVEDINYSDEELTLSAYDAYIRNNSSEFSAKIVSLFFKGALPVKDGSAIVKENEAFSFEINWENSAYAKNINYYFFNGTQRSIEYWSLPIPSNTHSFASTCQALEDYHFKCNGLVIDESKNYEGRVSPINSSFVMAICDRNTRDPDRICDFIRIPIVLQK